ncbi:ATP-binding cassette domain-containing protein [Chloroflexota bacterium]
MAIEVDHLIKHYDTIKAVDDISFQVTEAEIFGMLGPNGAGKTTTVEIIEGLRPADSGRVSVMGLDVSKAAQRIKQRIGIQLQAPSLLPLLRVEEMLDTFASFYHHHLPVNDILELLTLQESRKVLVKNLSGGQQQRLSVAMSLINDPEIAFLDEPTTGLDPQARRGLWSVIQDMQGRGKTVFLTTHYMEEAERLCDRVAIIDHGKIIALDTPDELIKSHFHEKAIHFKMESPPPEVVLRDFPGSTQVTIDGGEVIIYSTNIPATMSALLQFAESGDLMAHLEGLHVREATLEDVFLKLTGRRIRE